MACHTDILTKQVNSWYFWFAINLFAEDIYGLATPYGLDIESDFFLVPSLGV